MRSPRAQELSPGIPSSPPTASSSLEQRDEPEDTLSYSSPPDREESGLSPTQTLAASSPELPPLPPFPSLTRTQQTPSASSNVRQSEGEYYTASWGSPYQRLPLGYSDSSGATKRGQIPSSDDVDGSPSQTFDLSRLIPSRLPAHAGLAPTRPSTPTRGVRASRGPLFAARSSLDDKLVAERGNWASDAASLGERRSSQGSSIEWDLSASVLKSPLDAEHLQHQRGHKPRGDNLTVRQEDIWEALGKRRKQAPGNMQHSKYAEAPASPSAPAAPEDEVIAPTSSPQTEIPSALAPDESASYSTWSIRRQASNNFPVEEASNLQGQDTHHSLASRCPERPDGTPAHAHAY
jgi:hypothetical protein